MAHFRLLNRLNIAVRFALVVCPVYEDPEDAERSPFKLENVSPFSWSWLSTINRVNSQVQKVVFLSSSLACVCRELTSMLLRQTLVLVYVVIPARARVSVDLLASPACLAQYSAREVTVRRFIPARMRE